ncbi:MAG: hypothetical protein EBT55_02500, partial [Proteobacteria bacterium]|nr:hypothetical protein [Pseudomonadota bacterium]
EEFFVTGEEPVIPEVLAEPRGAAVGGAPTGGFAGGGEAPGIREDVGDPTAGAVIFLSGDGTGFL